MRLLLSIAEIEGGLLARTCRQIQGCTRVRERRRALPGRASRAAARGAGHWAAASLRSSMTIGIERVAWAGASLRKVQLLVHVLESKEESKEGDRVGIL